MACRCGEYASCVWSHSFDEASCPELTKRDSASLVKAQDHLTPEAPCLCGEYLGCVWKDNIPERDCPEVLKRRV